MTSLRQTAESRSGRRCKAAGERSSDSVPGRTGRPHRSTAVPACKNKQKTSQRAIRAWAAFRQEGRRHMELHFYTAQPSTCSSQQDGTTNATRHAQTSGSLVTPERCVLKDEDTNRKKGPKLQNSSAHRE